MTRLNVNDREYEILEILWKSSKPLLASEIMTAAKKASPNSVHHLLNKLMDKELVRVVKNVKVVKAQSRLYAPAISPVEYLAIQSGEIFKGTTKKFDLKNYLLCLTKRNKNENDEIIAEIKSFIEDYEKERKN